LHYFSTVLALDPANGAAKQGIDQIADHFASDSQTLIEQGRFAEAVNALQGVRRVRPRHVRLVPLEAELRSRLEQQFPQVRAPAVIEPEQAVATDVGKRTPRKAGDVPIAPAPRPEKATPQLSTQPNIDSGAMQGRMLADARQAIERGQLDTAGKLIAGARQVGVTQGDLAVLNQSLAGAEQKRVADDTQRVALQRTMENKPRETAGAAMAPPAVESAPNPVLAATSPIQAAASVAEPKLIKIIHPDYPGEARLRGIEGWVDLSFVVSPAGDVLEPRVENSNMKHLFARPALNAVRQWKYEPGAAAGPNPQRTLVRVQFKLNER
jgi:TonB family protein